MNNLTTKHNTDHRYLSPKKQKETNDCIVLLFQHPLLFINLAFIEKTR